MEEQEIILEEVGKVIISMYKHMETDLALFEVNTDSEDVEQIAYIIEDALYDF